VDELKSLGFGYGEMLKLQAVAEMSGKTIEELMYLDIFEEEDGEREIDFDKLATELGLEKDAIKSQFKQYKDAVRNIQKEQNESRKLEQQQKRDQIKQSIV